MTATNQSTSDINDLVGVYSFTQRTAAPDGSAAQAESGQLRIAADGSARLCEAQAFSEACKGLDGQDVVAQLVHVGGGRWNIKAGAIKLADFYPRKIDGVTSFLTDYAFTDDTGPRTGAGVMASSRNLESGSFNGRYDCFTNGAILGFTINGSGATDTAGNSYALTYNHGGSLFDGAWREFNAGALIEAKITGFAAPRGRFDLMALSTKELVGSGINGSGVAITFACVRP